jgi:hypothetical protein
MAFVSSSNVGSYVLSTSERAVSGDVDLQTACAKVLKILGAQKAMSLGALLSLTGFSVSLLRDVVAKLRKDELVAGSDDRLVLTDLGYKAHLIVAT